MVHFVSLCLLSWKTIDLIKCNFIDGINYSIFVLVLIFGVKIMLLVTICIQSHENPLIVNCKYKYSNEHKCFLDTNFLFVCL